MPKLQYLLHKPEKLENFDSWKKADILLLHQIFDNKVLQPFDKLAEKYHLSNKLFFQYLQLQHALQSRATTFLLKYNPSLILTLAITIRRSKQALIGDILYILPYKRTVRANIKDGNFLQWRRDLETLSDEEWEQALKKNIQSILILLTVSDQVIHYS